MTIITPLTAAGLGTVILRPLPDVQPFSIQSGYSFEGILSDMRVWLRDVLVPYLEDNSASAIFQSNVDTMIDTVNTALTNQSATVTAALNTAVNEVITAQVPIADPIVAALLALSTSATRVFLDNRYLIKAPKPSGNDDSAVLNALLATYGTIHLQEGTYKANLATPNAVIQPWIIGAGRHFTTLQAFDKTKPIVSFNGGSGSIAGGGVKSLLLDGTDRHITTTVGIAFNGAGGTRAEDVEIENCAVGVEFWNSTGTLFSEFDTFEGSIYNTMSPFVYRDDNGVESFHGSGPIGNTVVGMPADSTSAVISTIGNALPYNAPCSMSVFFTAVAQSLFNYVNATAGRHASFYGRITTEGQGAAQLGQGTNKVLFCGEIIGFGIGSSVLNNIFQCSKIIYDGGSVVGVMLPVTERYTLGNTPTQRFAGVLVGGETALVVVHIRAANYDVSQVLLCYQSLYDASGPAPTVLSTMVDIDTAGVGLPTYSWNGGLYISNPNYGSTFNAYAKMTVLGGAARSNDLAQLA